MKTFLASALVLTLTSAVSLKENEVTSVVEHADGSTTEFLNGTEPGQHGLPGSATAEAHENQVTGGHQNADGSSVEYLNGYTPSQHQEGPPGTMPAGSVPNSHGPDAPQHKTFEEEVKDAQNMVTSAIASNIQWFGKEDEGHKALVDMVKQVKSIVDDKQQVQQLIGTYGGIAGGFLQAGADGVENGLKAVPMTPTDTTDSNQHREPMSPTATGPTDTGPTATGPTATETDNATVATAANTSPTLGGYDANYSPTATAGTATDSATDPASITMANDAATATAVDSEVDPTTV